MCNTCSMGMQGAGNCDCVLQVLHVNRSLLLWGCPWASWQQPYHCISHCLSHSWSLLSIPAVSELVPSPSPLPATGCVRGDAAAVHASGASAAGLGAGAGPAGCQAYAAT
jgi:hypothetical protein